MSLISAWARAVVRTGRNVQRMLILGAVREGRSQRTPACGPPVGVRPGRLGVELSSQGIIEVYKVAHFIFSFNGKGMGRICKL